MFRHASMHERIRGGHVVILIVIMDAYFLKNTARAAWKKVSNPRQADGIQ
jgi:hypothetical protein